METTQKSSFCQWCISVAVESRNFKTIVFHRDGEVHIDSTPNRWRYVPTKLNPSDQARNTRSLCPRVSNGPWLVTWVLMSGQKGNLNKPQKLTRKMRRRNKDSLREMSQATKSPHLTYPLRALLLIRPHYSSSTCSYP